MTTETYKSSPKLRRKIFEQVVANGQPLYPAHRSRVGGISKFGSKAPNLWFTPRTNFIDQSYAKLVRTCRQIYSEVEETGLFYKINEFAFCNASDAHEFLAALPQKKRDLIRYVRIQYHLRKNDGVEWEPSEAQFFKWYQVEDISPTAGHIATLLRSCKGLRTLFVDLEPQCVENVVKSAEKKNPIKDEKEQTVKLFNRLEYEIASADLGPTEDREYEEDMLLGQLRQFEQFRLAVHFPSIQGDLAVRSREYPTPFGLSSDNKVVIDLTSESEHRFLDRLSRYDPAFGPLERAPIPWPVLTNGELDHWFYKNHKHLDTDEEFGDTILSAQANVAQWKNDGILRYRQSAPMLQIQEAIDAANLDS